MTKKTMNQPQIKDKTPQQYKILIVLLALLLLAAAALFIFEIYHLALALISISLIGICYLFHLNLRMITRSTRTVVRQELRDTPSPLGQKYSALTDKNLKEIVDFAKQSIEKLDSFVDSQSKNSQEIGVLTEIGRESRALRQVVAILAEQQAEIISELRSNKNFQ